MNWAGFGAAMLAVVPVIVHAADSRHAGRDEGNLETLVVTGTRTERAMVDVPASISLIDRQAIEREVAMDIADLVRFEPGVAVGGTGSRFGLEGFSIRGIGGNRVITMVDGIRVPDEFSFGPFLSARRDVVDLDALDRVEIGRGPVSSLYGSDALGGVVAFTTRSPQDLLDGSPFRLGFKGGWSSADRGTLGTLTAAAGREAIAAAVVFTRRRASETETAESGGEGALREAADPQHIEQNSLLAKLAWRPSPNHALTLTVDRFGNDTASDIRSDRGLSRGVRILGRDTDDRRTRRRYSLHYDYQGGAIVGVDRLAMVVYHQESHSGQATFDRRVSGGVEQARTRFSEFAQRIDGASAQLGTALDTGPVSHYLTWGGEYYITESAGLRDGFTVDAAGSPVFEFFPFPTRDFPPTRVKQGAVFIQDELRIASDRWRVTIGARWDTLDARAKPDLIYLTGNPGSPPPEDYRDAESTLSLGTVYSITDGLSLVARYSEGFRAPPYDDVNVGFTNALGGYKTISNPRLRSERSRGVELGLRLNGALGEAHLTGFRNDYADFIESFAIAPAFLSSGGIDPSDGLLTFQSVNRERVVIAGVEFRGALDLGIVNDWLERVSLRAAAAWARGEERSSGVPINDIEPLSAVFGVRYDDPGARFGSELLWTVSAAKKPSDIDPGSPRFATKGYGVVDLLFWANVGAHARLNVGVFNLTNKSYIRWPDSRTIGADAPGRFTQPGLNVAATVRIEL